MPFVNVCILILFPLFSSVEKAQKMGNTYTYKAVKRNVTHCYAFKLHIWIDNDTTGKKLLLCG